MNTRRHWLAAGAALPALAWMGALHAQAKAPVVIGLLNARSHRSEVSRLAFQDSMAALGWKHGAEYVVEERSADGHLERLPALAQELAAKNPALIMARPSTAAKAAAAAAPNTPIVLEGGDPLATGLVTNLARPDGMITGLSNVSRDLNPKVLQLLLNVLPKLRRVGVLTDTTSGSYTVVVADMRRAAERLGVEAVIVHAAKPEDLEPATARLAKEKVQALVMMASSWFYSHRARILQPAQAQRWPVVGVIADITRQGGLFSYGVDDLALIRRSAYYVDRILKGAKPGDLPIEQPTAFELLLNLKTARQLGITIPPSVLVLATEVIQ
jgi:putative tryptophan/tyrosine transport system substrate-binding protein